ncbi:hypothetical protein pb186bvf_011425 [Paramecium bursaria]
MQELSQDVTQVNALITQAGQNMQQMVQKREDDLLNLYKQEMLKVQRKLKKLSEESSEGEIRKKIQQHREQLENERQQYVKQSVELSNQVQELRKREKEILQSTQELLSDINFLDEQLIYADKHNLILQEELESLQEDYQRSCTQSKSQRFVQSQQGIQLPKLNNDRTNINKLKQTNEKLRQQINNQEEDEIERCFDEAIASVSETDISTMDLTCCNEFNEFQKRKIFEEFLQHPIVKQKIYELLIK